MLCFREHFILHSFGRIQSIKFMIDIEKKVNSSNNNFEVCVPVKTGVLREMFAKSKIRYSNYSLRLNNKKQNKILGVLLNSLQ